MITARSHTTLRLALPKGRMQEGVFTLLTDAGIDVRASSRGYRPSVLLPNVEAKILKPQNIIEMLHAGSRDLGFAGADWVRELKADVVEVLNTGLDSVRLVAAAPSSLLVDGQLPLQRLVVASEYEQLTADWIAQRGLDATFVRSYGATEVFPPEDADCIVDIAATGETLRANHLTVVDELMVSSTRMYASRSALDDPEASKAIEDFVMLARSVLEARRRVVIEVNVTPEALEAVVEVLPCMREATIAALHDGAGYAVKAAVLRSHLPRLIPEVKQRGGTDIIVTAVSQIIQ